MKKYIVFFWVFALLSCNQETSEGEEPEAVNFAVDTQDSQLPYFMVSVPEVIQNEPKVAGDLKVYLNRTEVHDTPIGIEYRGSTSYRLSDKKSYGIETWDVGGSDAAYSF